MYCRREPKLLSKGPLFDLVFTTSPSVGGCGCGRKASVASVMQILGMTTAASMHEGRNDATDDPALWRPHIKEEEDILFPRIVMIDATTSPVIDELLADHKVYLSLLDQGKPLPRGNVPHSIDRHAAIEDALIERYATQLRALAPASLAKVAGGYTDAAVKVSGGNDQAYYISAGIGGVAGAAIGALVGKYLGKTGMHLAKAVGIGGVVGLFAGAFLLSLLISGAEG